MAMLRTANPVLNANTFTGLDSFGSRSSAMTVQGAIGKTAVLLALLLAAAAWTWHLTSAALVGHHPEALMPWLLGGVIGGLVFCLITVFKKEWSPVTAPLYAICEGLALGAISGLAEFRYHGIVVQAVGMTTGVLAIMLAAYATGVVRVTEKFKAGVIAATGAICLFYFICWIMSFFGISAAGSILYGTSLLSIGISVVVVVIAALNLALDFDLIETGALAGAPKYMEWYSAFGLMVTLVWLYVEILRLLSKLRSRN